LTSSATFQIKFIHCHRLKTNLFSLAINSYGNLSLADYSFLIILTRAKNGVNTCPPILEYKILMLRNLLQLMLCYYLFL
jgi:hypothetical protein